MCVLLLPFLLISVSACLVNCVLFAFSKPTCEGILNICLTMFYFAFRILWQYWILDLHRRKKHLPVTYLSLAALYRTPLHFEGVWHAQKSISRKHVCISKQLQFITDRTDTNAVKKNSIYCQSLSWRLKWKWKTYRNLAKTNLATLQLKIKWTDMWSSKVSDDVLYF